MALTTIRKVGTSKGLILSKSLCDELGLEIGDQMELSASRGLIEMRPKRSYKRETRLTIDEIFADWHESYRPPEDIPSVGNEADWGDPCGNEMW